MEARLRRFDGEYRWFLFRAEPVRDENGKDGKVVRWYGTNTDSILHFIPHTSAVNRLRFIIAPVGVFLLSVFALVLTPRASAQSRGEVSNAGRAEQQAPQPAASASARKEAQHQKEITNYQLPPEKYKQAVEFARAKYRFYPIDVIYGFLILLAVLYGRLGPKLRQLAEGVSRRRFAQTAIFAPLLLTIWGVLGLPSDIYRQRLLLKYQQSVQTWGSWFWDWVKGGVVGLILATLLAWILYGIIRRSPRRWWFYFWLASIPILVLVLFIQPVVIDPLFYKFEPLESTQPALVKAISKVVDRSGMKIPPSHMFEMKASEKLNEVNAYVSGIGASKRVVVWDTTISKMTTPQVLLVFGHEMGHYVLGHIWKGVAFAIAMLFVLLYLALHGANWALRRWGQRWDIRGVEDWASLPLLLLLFSVFTFLGTPAFNSFSRHQEHQADVYGIEVTHGIVPDSPKVEAQVDQVLGEIDLSDPDPNPVVEFWLFSHPSIKERIEFALHYDPWSKGQQPEFVR